MNGSTKLKDYLRFYFTYSGYQFSSCSLDTIRESSLFRPHPFIIPRSDFVTDDLLYSISSETFRPRLKTVHHYVIPNSRLTNYWLITLNYFGILRYMTRLMSAKFSFQNGSVLYNGIGHNLITHAVITGFRRFGSFHLELWLHLQCFLKSPGLKWSS
jgi:hypothetical protein